MLDQRGRAMLDCTDQAAEILIVAIAGRCLELAMLYRPTERDDEA